MPRPTEFGSSFNPAQFRGGGRAQLMIRPVDSANPNGSKSGDIIAAFNRRRIRHVNAQHFCKPVHAGFNGDGLRPTGLHHQAWFEATSKYKFERLSTHEVRRTNLITLDDEVIDQFHPTEPMLVDEYIRRRIKHARHKIFGTAGAEVWYGGSTDVSWEKMDIVWESIETHTPNLESNNWQWPATPRELRRYGWISSTDFTDEDAGRLTRPLLDLTDPENPITVAKHEFRIQWQDLRGAIVSVWENENLISDIRPERKHVLPVIEIQKSI